MLTPCLCCRVLQACCHVLPCAAFSKPMCIWEGALNRFAVFRDKGHFFLAGRQCYKLSLLSWLELGSLKLFRSFKKLYVEASRVMRGRMQPSLCEAWVCREAELCGKEGSALWTSPAS